METSTGVSEINGIDCIEHRDTLYFNKFKYKAEIKILGSVYTRFCKTPDDFIFLLKNSLGHWNRNIVYNLSIISKLINFRNSIKDNKIAMTRIVGDIVYVYSNDLPLLKTVRDMDDTAVVSFTEAVIPNIHISGVKYFTQDPKHKYRVYLKNIRVANQTLEDLENTLNSLKGELTPSKSLKYWLDSRNTKTSWGSRFMYSYYYIDYNNEQMLSYLALLYGDYLSKTLKLEKRP